MKHQEVRLIGSMNSRLRPGAARSSGNHSARVRHRPERGARAAAPAAIRLVRCSWPTSVGRAVAASSMRRVTAYGSTPPTSASPIAAVEDHAARPIPSGASLRRDGLPRSMETSSAAAADIAGPGRTFSSTWLGPASAAPWPGREGLHEIRVRCTSRVDTRPEAGNDVDQCFISTDRVSPETEGSSRAEAAAGSVLAKIDPRCCSRGRSGAVRASATADGRSRLHSTEIGYVDRRARSAGARSGRHVTRGFQRRTSIPGERPSTCGGADRREACSRSGSPRTRHPMRIAVMGCSLAGGRAPGRLSRSVLLPAPYAGLLCGADTGRRRHPSSDQHPPGACAGWQSAASRDEWRRELTH